jgi:DHA1 family multidrug resistance protein-like MFS transporter
MRGKGLLPDAPATERRLVVGLGAMTFLLWFGAGAMLPLLPSYLHDHGSSAALVGIIMASYFIASVISQYPAGIVCDRIGQKPVILAGLVIFAGGSVGFAFASSPGAAIVFRSLQGIGAGAATVGAVASIGVFVVLERRGRSFGTIYGAQFGAFAVGPLVGSIIGSTSIRALFIIGAAFALCAAVPVLTLLNRAKPTISTSTDAIAPRPRPGALLRARQPALIGAVITFASMGMLVGVYESCWTLLLRSRDASSFSIGLSWTLFAVPFAVLSIPAGRLAERVDRRKLAIGALCCSAAFACSYPFLPLVGLLLGFGVLEAIGSVVGSPATVLIVSEAVPSQSQGEAQGALESARTGATALSAAVSGALFGVNRAIPFVVGSAVVFASLGAIARLWRQVPGRISQRPVVLPPVDVTPLR